MTEASPNVLEPHINRLIERLEAIRDNLPKTRAGYVRTDWAGQWLEGRDAVNDITEAYADCAIAMTRTAIEAVGHADDVTEATARDFRRSLRDMVCEDLMYAGDAALSEMNDPDNIKATEADAWRDELLSRGED